MFISATTTALAALPLFFLPPRWRWLPAALLSIALVKALFWDVVRTSGPSMSPTIPDGSVAFINRAVYSDWPILPHQPIRRGDIVAFRSDAGALLIKRVAAVPGDSVFFSKGVWILPETTIPAGNPHTLSDWVSRIRGAGGFRGQTRFSVVTPANRLFLIGDNPKDSLDSRFFGFVPSTSVIGRIDRVLQ